jgi:hypothetical protein
MAMQEQARELMAKAIERWEHFSRENVKSRYRTNKNRLRIESVGFTYCRMSGEVYCQ